MNYSFRNFLIGFLITISVGGFSILALNVYVDPWHFFHDSSVASWQGKGRLQNPGILRQKTLSSVVIGTSMTQNFQPADVEKLFPGDAAILSISAGTGREQSLLALMAIREQEGLGNIIWGLHPGSFSLPSDEVKGSSFPLYLYDENSMNDFLYLFNLSNSKKALRDLLTGRSPADTDDWKNLQYWSGRYQYGCPEALELQVKRRGLPSPADDWLGSPLSVHDNVRDNLHAVVVGNPNVNFSFFFPPFSSLYWSILAESQPHRYYAYRSVMSEVVKQLIELPNVRIFDFTAALSITENLDNYRDLTHFSGSINSQLLEFMAEGKFEVRYDGLLNIGKADALAIYSDVGTEVLRCLSTAKH